MRSLLKRLNLVTLLIAAIFFIFGWQLGHRDLLIKWENYQPKFSLKNEQPPTSSQIDFKLFWDTWDLVSKKYVDKKALDPQKMYYGAIAGMVQALGDPYTAFLPPEAQKATKEVLGGSFDGVGIQLGFNKEKRLVVITPLKGTPAEKVGVKPGDIILKVGDSDTQNMSIPEAVNLIRGPKGSKVTLEIFHEGDKNSKTVSLVRDTIIVKSVEFEEKITSSGEKIAYIKLTRFGERTESEWNKAVSHTLASGASGVILDVRNNPGGFLDGSVFIGSEFIASGNIVLQEDGGGNRLEFKVNRAGKLLRLPLVVLINKGSASASEIVAGAIQDHKRGQLVGEVTFGKGTIQEAQDLAEGTGIHITTAKWLTPNGHWIHNIGLTPDIVVEAGDDAEKDPQLDRALELIEKLVQS